ncbi:MAG: lysophospholipid acyltransferase family protein [Acidiferrobacterales bacterium]
MPAPVDIKPLLHPRYWPSWVGYVFLRAVAILPLPVIWVAGGVFGSIFYLLHAERRNVALVNIGLCFPELPDHARKSMARRHFREFVRAALAVPIAWWGSARRLERLVHCRDCHHFDDAIAEGRPIILLVPHFVGIEIGGMYLASAGDPQFIDMYKRPKNPLFDYMIWKGRLRFGGTLVERFEGIKPVIRGLKQGMVFYYLPDQDPGSRGSVFVAFFGVPAATLTALGRLAAITNAVVIPCFTRQLPYGQGYEVIFRPPLDDFPTGDELVDARRMNEEIEAGVSAMPEQYFWVHKRFKTRPPGVPEYY